VKVKRHPEDFQVEERTNFRAQGGPFAFYRLSKRWIGTPEAVQAIAQHWDLERRQISYGGLKDFHGITHQYLTIWHGPNRGLRLERCELSYLGQAPRAFTAQDIAGNRFQVVLRDIPRNEIAPLRKHWERLQREGVPNYFDEQRFGSVGESGEFVALPWCRGNYERALWLALAEPNSHDQPNDREEKQLLRDHWGDFVKCKELLPRSSRRSIVTFLVDRPGDFRGAMARVNIDLRGIYLAAFQSAMWNQILAAWLRRECRPTQLHDLETLLGPLPIYEDLDENQRAKAFAAWLPLPSARLKLDPGPDTDLMLQTIRAAGLEMREMRLKHPRDTFFSKGERPLVLRPTAGEFEPAPDERYQGQQKLHLAFDLPRGAYATLILKCLGCLATAS